MLKEQLKYSAAGLTHNEQLEKIRGVDAPRQTDRQTDNRHRCPLHHVLDPTGKTDCRERERERETERERKRERERQRERKRENEKREGETRKRERERQVQYAECASEWDRSGRSELKDYCGDGEGAFVAVGGEEDGGGGCVGRDGRLPWMVRRFLRHKWISCCLKYLYTRA